MVKVNLLCGLGNQLFQYAYARAISEEFGDKTIVLNRTLFGKMAKLASFGHVAPADVLRPFQLNENIVEAKGIKNFFSTFFELVLFCTYHQNIIPRKFNQEVFEKLSSRGIYMQGYRLEYSYYKHSKKTKDKKVVMDFFISGKYFENIKDILHKEFQVITPLSKENADMIKELNSCNSVCVHIRRGDIKINPKFARYNVCNERYYKEGMEYVAQRTKDPIFFVFSNSSKDIQWIKEHYHFKYPVKYVDLSNPGIEDFRLMYNCKHFVLSNSTFGWWASFMSENEDKIIIVPDKGRRDAYNGHMDNYRDDMIPLHVNLDEMDPE